MFERKCRKYFIRSIERGAKIHCYLHFGPDVFREKQKLQLMLFK